MQELVTKFLDLIYENSCLICNNAAKHFIVCNGCEKSFIQRKTNYIKHFDKIKVYSFGFYEGTLKSGILALKSGKKKMANYFSNKLIEFTDSIPEQIIQKDQLVIGVPSHKKRIKERGYCQSTLMANHLASVLGLNFSNELIVRKKETKYMNSLSNLNERKENVKDAFCTASYKPKEKNILIVDDILTSGSTMCEMVRTIRGSFPDLNLVGLTVASGDTYT